MRALFFCDLCQRTRSAGRLSLSR